MRDTQDLAMFTQFMQLAANHLRHTTTDACIHFVKD
jgi:hypothetical protein